MTATTSEVKPKSRSTEMFSFSQNLILGKEKHIRDLYIEVSQENAYRFFGYNSTASDEKPFIREYNENSDEYCNQNYPYDYDGLRNVSIIICFFNEHWITLWEQFHTTRYN